MVTDLSFWNSVTPERLFAAVAEPDNLQFVLKVMNTLTFDQKWSPVVMTQVEAGQIEIRCFVSWLARELGPTRYLEVGVRRGFSMAMVVSQCPDVEVYGFDKWVKNYADVQNPGPDFVQSEMDKVGYKKKINFVSGNSHRTLPAFFRGGSPGIWERVKMGRGPKTAPLSFDLITVDGDHSLLGAYQDLMDTMPRCAVGGVVVFDDIVPDLSVLDPQAVREERGDDPHGWTDLLGVWRAVQPHFSNFRYFEYTANPSGVGIAVRVR